MSEHAAAPEADHVSARRRETRTRLLDAAAEVFAEFGIQGASVERICARADFSRGAFYSNFSSKEELFLALLGREYEQRADQIRLRAAELTACLEEAAEPPSREDAADFVTAFLSPSGSETGWFTLETEFLLLALRHPEGEIQHVDFNLQFRSELSNVVESIVHAAGRRFIIPVDRSLTILAGAYERALRVSAVSGFDAPEGVNELGDRFAELLFTITEPV
ncbi:TetR family transcriptional regulator [Leucobacter komagatae]|uniref:TetR family transcriptional regulator n=1 Tax=Leucobacter komagatae TaxID=55969 RepID=A0A542Y7L2_9MICO|nr:TetR/AcrR family transcriptional regulator [Leucobacter komagatae]TQL44103.1 TetR family transcriptional regulator [Leucobacter komagatae]